MTPSQNTLQKSQKKHHKNLKKPLKNPQKSFKTQNTIKNRKIFTKNPVKILIDDGKILRHNCSIPFDDF
jgi:thiamine pyrophosphokinase